MGLSKLFLLYRLLCLGIENRIFFYSYEIFIFKVGFSSSKKVGFICFSDSLLKMMSNNSFHLISKTLFVLVTVLTFLVLQGNDLRISKFMTSQTGKQIIKQSHVAQYLQI